MSEWALNSRAELARDDFAQRVAKNFVREHQPPNLDPEVVAKFVRKYKEGDSKLVRSALAVIDDRCLKDELIRDFAEALEKEIIAELKREFRDQQGLEWSLTGTISNSNLAKSYPAISFRRLSWPEGYEIGIEAKKVDEKVYFGISKLPKADPKADMTIVNNLNGKLNAAFPEYGLKLPRKYWVWCPWIDPDLGGIDMSSWYSRETLEAMHDERRGPIIESLVELLISVARIVDDYFQGPFRRENTPGA